MLQMRKIRGLEKQESQNRVQQLRQRFSWRKLLLRILPRILLRLLLPLILYQVTERFFPLAEWEKLCLAATVPLFFIVLTRLRTRSFDLLSVLMLSGLVFSLLLTLFTQAPTMLSLREPLLHGLFSLICLGSLVIAQPLAWKLYVYIMSEGNPTQKRGLEEALQQEPSVLSTFRLVTLIAGCVLIAIAIVHVSLVLWLRELLAHAVHRSLLHTSVASGSLYAILARFLISIGSHLLDITMDILPGLWVIRKLTPAHRLLRTRIPFLTTQAL